MGLNQKVQEEANHKKKDDFRLKKEIENKLKFQLTDCQTDQGFGILFINSNT